MRTVNKNNQESSLQDTNDFFRKLDESLKKAWESGVLNQKLLDELRKVDINKYNIQEKCS